MHVTKSNLRKKSIQGAKCLLSPSGLILFKVKVSLMFSWSDELSTDANVVLESLNMIVYFSLCMLTQLCPTLWGPMDCSPSGSSTHDIFQARILEWVAISYSKASSQLRNRTHVSCISYNGKQILYHSATWEAQTRTTRKLVQELLVNTRTTSKFNKQDI